MTVLVAGDDGRVRLWKATSGNVWRAAGSVSVEQQPSKQRGAVGTKRCRDGIVEVFCEANGYIVVVE